MIALPTSPESLLLAALELAIFACLMLMSLYHLVLFLFRRSECSTLAFAAICFFWGSWSMHTPMLDSSSAAFHLMFPDFPPDLQLRWELLSLAWAVWSILVYFPTLYPNEFSPRLARLFQVAVMLYSGFVMLSPIRFAMHASYLCDLFGVFVMGYSIRGCIATVKRKRHAAWAVLAGCLVLAATGVNDILKDMGVIQSLYLSPMSVLLFCFSQAVVLANKLQQAYTDISEKLAMEQALKVQRKSKADALLQLEKERLAKLRYQLNPHFLFNSFTAIRGAILLDAKMAKQMVSDLAELCRASLTLGAKDLITVREEMTILDLYLRIERTRLGDKLVIEIQGDENVYDKMIPTLLLQPIAENAIKHGRKTSKGPLTVRVEIERGETSGICIRVSNTGCWIPPSSEEREDSAEGFGLTILKERLERLYPGAYRFLTREEHGWVHVELYLSESIPAQDAD